ncbi:hypothetical protein [Allosalinactinospora lopnorensis]|uniref:hypothetical protein n=1 Tax=Allosalinactinospora lopnorensis TaxID=1352348 RepID=UPI000623CCD9|nr:hypothetical protein [Allosalinactinospora lopnorensis]
MEDCTPGSTSVYHGGASPGAARPLRAFFVDVYDEDTDSLEHAYYGVAREDGDGLARTMTGTGIHTLHDVESFAERIGGEIVWV